ncbi:MAG: CxxC-x17-CxxC domain-containing protein [Candidatus Omnitrophota bacterium]
MKKDKAEADIAGLLDKMHLQLVVLEKKVDVLIQKAAARPAEVMRPHQQPQHHQQPFHHQKQYYKAICADCNKECEVPFRPTGDRPVYCKDCFSKRKNSAPSGPRHDDRPAVMTAHHSHPAAKEGRARKRPFGKKRAGSHKRKK